jgi:hypothetical protein
MSAELVLSFNQTLPFLSTLHHDTPTSSSEYTHLRKIPTACTLETYIGERQAHLYQNSTRSVETMCSLIPHYKPYHFRLYFLH